MEVVETQRSSGVYVSRQTVGRVLKRAGLKACCLRKTPLLRPVLLKARVEFVFVTLIKVLHSGSKFYGLTRQKYNIWS